MMSRQCLSRRGTRRTLLLLGVSAATLASSLGSRPAAAQTAGALLRQQAGAPRPQGAQPTAAPVRSPTMQAALAQQRATVSRIDQIRAYAGALRQAVARTGVTDGLSPDGLDPTQKIRDAIAAVKAGDTARANQLLVSAGAANDPSGTNTWEGAGLPTQTIVDGRAVVTIDQTQQHAILSWNRFNVGANTTLQFNQKENATAKPGWVVVNRVTNATDPSLILGNVKADGTVVVLNRAGIIFGKNSQVNAHALLASTLELGRPYDAGSASAESLQGRNARFLDQGLFVPSRTDDPAILVSAVAQTIDGTTTLLPSLEGSVTVDSGARLSTDAGGFLILAAPRIFSSGTLRAVDGQVSLQAGRVITFVESTGAASSPDPDVRGYKLTSVRTVAGRDGDDGSSKIPQPGEEAIYVDGVIDSRRGYLSLGTSLYGSVENDGLLSTTTSVSRNGKIAIRSGKVTLGGNADAGKASGIAMIADDNGETIPQGSATVPATFKTSKLEINASATTGTAFTMGENALVYAPGATVTINGASDPAAAAPTIDIAAGATIDVSGYKDVALDASRNSIEITPVKRNELRDTPNYREVALDGNFTLNGATLYVDPRLSGVRDDGVAWVGSPLIEAGSLASQISVTAQEFMTKAGSVSLLGGVGTTPPVVAAGVRIAKGARIDVSGGWVRYDAGVVRTSRLITDDGRIVDIGRADPNDTYVGVVDGVQSVQPRFGVLRTYLNASSQGLRFDPAYDEGRDAGWLKISGPSVQIDGTIAGNAFAGARQIAAGERPSLASTISGDVRLLQRSPYQLPSGGGVSLFNNGETLIYHGEPGSADRGPGVLRLQDDMLNSAGISALLLESSGAISFTAGSDVELAPGGALRVKAGRTIRFDGTVTAASGSIEASTESEFTARTAIASGSWFRTDDDLGTAVTVNVAGVESTRQELRYASDPGQLHPHDVIVTGTLSTAGQWVNDYTETGAPQGGAFRNGGSITLTPAGNVFFAVGDSIDTATQAVDLSGSVRVSGTLNVMAGGYVSPTGKLLLDGKGGNVSLRATTTYASSGLTFNGLTDTASYAGEPLPILNQRVDNQSVDFTPISVGGQIIRPRLVPTPQATVDIADATILGFGFAGGGTFSLVAPNISFGSDNPAGSTHIGLDFFRTTGFGTLDASSYRARIVDNLFSNARGGKSAFFETTRFTVGAGETLDLTQWLLPSVLTADQIGTLRTLGTGADLRSQQALAPSPMDALWDRKAAHLVLGGLTELDVMAGGTITGAPEASLTVNKLYNAGTIALHGGTIAQGNTQDVAMTVAGLGVRDVALGGQGLADAFGGPVDAAGRFSESAANAAGITDPLVTGRLITNAELVSRQGVDRLVYFLGRLDGGEGIRLVDGSVTDLSGTVVLNPRAAMQPGGPQLRTGRLYDGGSITLRSARLVRPSVETGHPAALDANTLVRTDGAAIDISGTSSYFDQATGLGTFAPYFEWSAAGTISALGGGSLGTTAINARGGVAQAQGGTLEWLQPTLGTDRAGGADYLLADMVSASGFDSLTARGSLTLDGRFSLTLRKAFSLLSQDATTNAVAGADAQVRIGATQGTDATVGANYVRLASRVSDLVSGSASAGDASVTLAAGAQGLDVVGGIQFDASIATAALVSTSDVRLIGVKSADSSVRAYSGQLVANGDLLIDARRTYATTGTGNLQALLEGSTVAAAIAPYDIAVTGDHSITFGNRYLDASAAAPLSAGTHLRVLAPRIVQNGYLAAPLGLIELGSNTPISKTGFGSILPTTSLTFGGGSVTTVSGAGLTIPYGTTTDLKEYYYPTLGTPITRVPSGELRLAAGSIVEAAGARIDGRGGGDVFAYEFQAGVGGSRDVLDRFSRDPYSSNGFDPATGIGYQYADQRQVFALVPLGAEAKAAAYDPTYSADYGSSGPVDLYGASAGRTVRLDPAPGVPGGEYLLVPAKYAMAIPGALRLVENGGASVPVPGQSTTLLDGSIVVGGSYGFADTGIAESTRRSFTVQSRDTFTKYSKITTTSGTDTIVKNAAAAGIARSRVPLDAARVVLSPLTELRVAGVFDTTPAKGGQGGQFDLLGTNLVITAEETAPTAGTVTLTAASLAALGANSLLIGGERSDAADGTTRITASASSILLQRGVTLDTPELLLAVGGAGSSLTIEDGVTLKATNPLGTTLASDYSATTAGSLLRLANGDERLVTRTGTGAATLQIGAATLSGGALALDTSGSFAVADAATLAAQRIAISGSAIQFNADPAAAGQSGVIGAALEAKLGAAQRLTVRSPGAVRFSTGAHQFQDLVLDTAALAAVAGTTAGDVTINADAVSLHNSTNAADGCAATGFCGTATNLVVNGGLLRLGANALRASGFTTGVTLGARDGIYIEDKGSFTSGSAALTLLTPFLADRALVADPRDQKVRPAYSFLTSGAFTLAAPAGSTAKPAGDGAPGASIAIGTLDAPVLSVAIRGSTIRATAGVIDVQSRGDIVLAGATLSTPGYEKTFGDEADATIVSAGGGTLNLQTRFGNLSADAASTLITDTGVGKAGTLNLLAGNGGITLDATLNPGVKGNRTASLAYDSGTSGFDFSGFVARYGTLFGGDVQVRSGAGDLALAAGQTLKARRVTLTADGGAITIAGTIDTAGASITGLTADAARDAAVDGGDIALWGRTGVTLAGTARLDTHTSGHADSDSRVASAGNVTIGIEDKAGAITIANGAVIDVGARRTQAALAADETGARLVPQLQTDPLTSQTFTVYTYAAPDTGGTVVLRAPVLGAGEDKVAVGLHGTIVGADQVQLEAFKRYDLDALASSGLYAGMSRAADGTLLLNMAASSASGGLFNPFTENFALADGSASVVRFVQNFAVSTQDGSSLSGIRLRPGVELASTGAIQTTTQWNLAAASFSTAQLQAAATAGVLQLIPELSTGGQTRYSVVAGQEGALLDRFATFLYRAGGSARGEAPVVTFRAGGNLTINRSISDGFFTFRDKSDASYINWQLGGGDRTYSPALQFSCGALLTCGAVPGYADGVANDPGAGKTIVIGLGSQAVKGNLVGANAGVASPLAIAGNGAAGGGDAGDALGFGELFPLLDGNVAMHASDLRLVAGVDSRLSVNPLHVDRARDADMIVAGQYSYRLTATAGSVSFAGPLDFSLSGNATPLFFDVGSTLDQTTGTQGLNALRDDAYTQLNWGSSSGLGADARAAAQAYFAGKGYGFIGTPGAETGITAPLNEVIGFLQSFQPTYLAGLASNASGYSANRTVTLTRYGTAAQQNSPTGPNQAWVRSYVRSGDGSIDMAAPRDVDLRGAADLTDRAAITYRKEDGTAAAATAGDAYAFSAAAAYTAGVRVPAAAVTARIVGGGIVSVQPDSPYLTPAAENPNFLPSPKGLSDSQPVLATGGGDVGVAAGRDVLGAQDQWSEQYLGTGARTSAGAVSTSAGATIGQTVQRWRTGDVAVDTEIGIAPRYFTSGVGALGGGDMSVVAGRDAVALTIALTNGVTSSATADTGTMLLFGNGNLTLATGRDMLAGRFDIASGTGTIAAGRDITSYGLDGLGATATPRYARIRLSDAVVDVRANGALTLASVSALGVSSAADGQSVASMGFFSPAAAVSLQANEAVTLAGGGSQQNFYGRAGVTFDPNNPNALTYYLQILPPSMTFAALAGSVALPSASGNVGAQPWLYPSAIGQLRLFSDGDLTNLAIAMSDLDPGLLPGAFHATLSQSPYNYPYVIPRTTEADLRNQHNRRITHAGDDAPVRIYSNGDITNSALFLPKQARIGAGGDIVDMFFSGQNLTASDITRIRAGGDITGSIATTTGFLPFVRSNDFTLGGPGTLILEAGGNIGPFVSSATIDTGTAAGTQSFAGGVRTIGNENNPWLPDQGADLQVRFGMAGGADYAALRETYLNPVNAAKLDGDLFVQVTDRFGNQAPDRTKPVYAPQLAAWLRDKAPDAFAAIFGGQSFADDAALATAAYGKAEALYQAFAAIDPLHQQDFLINRLYFGEIAAVVDAAGPSYQQYVRGYRAVQTLFPTSRGYTDNLAPYTIDPATISPDHPLGEPVRNLVDGQPARAARVRTGDLDLRLATLQTVRGGDVSVIGPGGDVLAGSIVRASEQPALRGTGFASDRGAGIPPRLLTGQINQIEGSQFVAVPIGYEGLLTLRGGALRSFTDGDFVLNQSRAFTQQGGDILMWSSNGDLNAGQGPKSASTFPPITIRLDQDGLADVNSAGSVSGAGIGTFKRTPDDPASDVLLIAPVGEVDAGDAGVRASGNVVVAAARVANADNFKAAGNLTGVPSAGVTRVAVTPAGANEALSQLRAATRAAQPPVDRRSIITVDVLGPASDGVCESANASDDPDCITGPGKQP
jgi:filamentous hemagglutinin family protein